MTAALRRVFQPLALTMSIGAETAGSQAVEWQPGTVEAYFVHRGVGLSSRSRYESVRIGRESFKRQRAFSIGTPDKRILEKDIGMGIRCHIPLVLYLPAAPPGSFPPQFEALQAALSAIEPEQNRADRADTRLAAVIYAWNILRHFYPYQDAMRAGWEAALRESLAAAITTGAGTLGGMEILARLLEKLQDGHAGLNHPANPDTLYPYFLTTLVEDKIVATYSRAEEVKPGDVILEVDGQDARQQLDSAMALISGSPQWKRAKALQWWSLWGKDSEPLCRLKIRRGKEELAVQTKRLWYWALKILKEICREAFYEIEEGYYYCNLERLSKEQFEGRLEELARAKGVVFDLRGYPKIHKQFLCHLIDEPAESAYFKTPIVYYPDREEPITYETTRWNLPPEKPRIKGKVAFLNDGSAMSYSESLLAIVRHYGLGTIIGTPTAGANGNGNGFRAPGGYSISFTGMLVLQHDGSPHHLVGIKPDIYTEPTPEGIRQGRDELLEKAVVVIKEE
ncbi:MAG: hypothetical protein H6559_24340 [Lewinellaceae bacterium]|nr:hypothetical protein [Lewinellaceae bacterium]